MSQLLGETKLIAYDDIPMGWIGTKFGQDGKFSFAPPDLRGKAPPGLVYCIAAEGRIPAIQDESGGPEDR